MLKRGISKMGRFTAGTGSTACVYLFFDEPRCPKSFIR